MEKVIENILLNFSKICGTTLVEKLANKAVEESGVSIKIENMKIGGELTKKDAEKLISTMKEVFASVFGMPVTTSIFQKAMSNVGSH